MRRAGTRTNFGRHAMALPSAVRRINLPRLNFPLLSAKSASYRVPVFGTALALCRTVRLYGNGAGKPRAKGGNDELA